MSRMNPAIMITGPRQVGKTTLLKNVCQDVRFLSFDDIKSREYASESPKQFFATNPPPVLLDEVQYVPEIFSYIKMLIDDDRKAGMFFMTGSQTFHQMKNATESLAGRVGIIELLGLSLREIMEKDLTRPFVPTADYLDEAKDHDRKKISNDDLWDVIHMGSMPLLHTVDHGQEDRSQYYADYVRTYIEKDVRSLMNVGNEMAFMRFMRLLAANTGQMINFSRIAGEIGKDTNTVKSWVSILQNSGIIYLLEPYFSNINKRIVKTPKVYFLDTGLCAYLAGWYTAEQLQFGAMSGSIFETFVISEIIKSYRNKGIDTFMRLSYYRDRNQNEIDLIIEENGVVYPVEIKKSVNPNTNDVASFKILKNETDKMVGDGALICSVDDLMFLKDDVRAIPVRLL
jgi:predicted AAA+ superfamily ATPase